MVHIESQESSLLKTMMAGVSNCDMKVLGMVIRFLFVASCLSLLALWGVAACFPLFDRSIAHAVCQWIALSLAIVASLYDMKLYYMKNIKSEVERGNGG